MWRIDRKSLESLYYSYVRPILEYCDVIYDNCTKAESEKLDAVQLAAARVVTGATRGMSHRLLYSELKWEKLEERRRVHRLKTYYKIIKDNRTPATLRNLVPEPSSSRSTYSLRNPRYLLPPPARTKSLYDSFILATTRDWNKLTEEVRNISTIEAFGYRLRDKEKVEKYYYTGNRRGQIYHARLRLQCSKLNAHLFERNITDSPACSCGADNETPIHYLLECTNFTNERDKLFEELSNYLALPADALLIGSDALSDEENKMLFENTQQYILQTKRFAQ
jgi:hypothetical protein